MPSIVTRIAIVVVAFCLLNSTATIASAQKTNRIAFFEKKIRPILAQHCYKCHSEAAKKQRGGLLLDRKSGWLKGGDTDKAVVPGNPAASLLIKAVRHANEDLKMPPGKKLDDSEIRLLETWVRLGAHGPDDPPDSAFSLLGNQKHLFAKAKQHWAFQPVAAARPPKSSNPAWDQHAIDRFVFAELTKRKLSPSPEADPRTLIRRLTYDLTGLPPSPMAVKEFVTECKSASGNPHSVIAKAVDRLLASPAFGEHIGRMWLDVARYADTDSFYRPDTKTPHYFPFAFTYRDYVIDAFNKDKPYDQFLREQLAADLMGFDDDAPETAALGFFAVGPHANRNPLEALDDWIDVTTRGLMGVTAACARCHDHKYEPVPTVDYYSLRGVFASMIRFKPLDEKNLPVLKNYVVDEKHRAAYLKKRAAIETKIKNAGNKTKGGNNRSIAKQIRETELAELLLFHPGAPVHTMIVRDKRRPVPSFVYLRGDARNRGPEAPRRFLKILDSQQTPFASESSGRLQLAEKIVSGDNPLTARVFVNRVWGFLMGSHLVNTPSDFGLQGSAPTHPRLLDWLAADFMENGWSVKKLVRQIVLSKTYQQSSAHRAGMAKIDPANKYMWRANRKHLSIEALRDSLLAVSGQLNRTPRGRPGLLWGKDYTRRRSIYGYINRFNLDPTLRTFDFPTPMQTQPGRGESIVPAQALFTLNSPFVIDQANALTKSQRFASLMTDEEKIDALYRSVFQREPSRKEAARIRGFAQNQQRLSIERPSDDRSPWPLVVQALFMSNEFQYVD